VQLATEQHLNQSVDAFPELGYVVIPGLLSAEEADELSRWFDEFSGGVVVGDGRRFLNERDAIQHEGFVRLLLKPRLVEVVRRFIGDDVQLLSYDCAETGPGAGDARRWHIELPFFTDATLTVAAGVYLTDITEAIGPLYIVPGSHLWRREPLPGEREAELDGEVAVTMPGGTAVIFHGALWHSTSANRSDRPRRALFPYFGRYWMKRLDDFFRRPLPAHVIESGDPLVRQLFGLELSVPSVHGEGYWDGPRWW
jgi:ectoine hydroxylase-related dioxygenase (phytanoyl-CoA dioxygenase family)